MPLLAKNHNRDRWVLLLLQQSCDCSVDDLVPLEIARGCEHVVRTDTGDRGRVKMSHCLTASYLVLVIVIVVCRMTLVCTLGGPLSSDRCEELMPPLAVFTQG